jgi:WD repeat-containing protein 68
LRLWDINLHSENENENSAKIVASLKNNSDYNAPLTSFDWNKEKSNMIGTSSIDTTCTIWDIEQEMVQTQLIAHDKSVFDICFANHES